MRHAAARAMGVRGRACADVRARIAPPEPKHVVAASVDPSSVPAYAREALDVLLKAGKQAFVVGGFVRDALRGVEAHDVDMTTDALWYQTRDIFIERGYHVVETGVRHGTVTVFVGGRPVEITTFRTDGTYSDHRRPDSVRFVRNVEDDLARRDFTVNAMAWSPAAGLVDPFGGRADLEDHLVRAVGDPDRRFEEDALRILRGVRFASKLGFAVEDETSASMHEHGADLAHVAIERIAVEYDGIVQGKGAACALRSYADVAAYAVPAIIPMIGFDQRSRWHCYDVWEHCLHALEQLGPAAAPIVRHVVLLHDVGKPSTFTLGSDGRGHFYGHEEQGSRLARKIFTALRWRSSDVDRACCLIRLHDYRIDPSPKGVRRILARLSRSFAGAEAQAPQMFEELLQVKRADTLAHEPSCISKRMGEIDRVEATFRELMAGEATFCVRDLAVNGSDVIEAGVPQGPAVGRVLRRLLSEVIDGNLPNDRDALLSFVLRRDG